MNWCIQGDGTWIVLPTVCNLQTPPLTCATLGANNNAGWAAAWNVIIAPSGTTRNQNDIFTAKCLYSDFNLKLSYRCPNMRTTWTNCGSPILGPRNWGNSGVKIFTRSAAAGAEVAILDFDWPAAVPFVNSAGVNIAVPDTVTGIVGCSGNTQPLTYGQLCGAVYNKITPQAKPAITPATSAANNPLPAPMSAYNSLEIGFMAARYNAAGTLVKMPTITVKINNNAVITHVGIPGFTKVTQVADVYLAGPNKGQPIYPGTVGWTRDSGPIYLQEHDNAVQFKDITINPDWLPMENGAFDQTWQPQPPP